MENLLLEGDKNLVSVNLAIRIEMTTDESIDLLNAIDTNNPSILREKSVSFKSMFFALYYRTHSLFEKIGASNKTLSSKIKELDDYNLRIQAHPKELDALELLRKWRIFCDLLNESGITDLLKSSGPRSYAQRAGDE